MSLQVLLSQSDVIDIIGTEFDATPSARLVIGIARSQTVERHQSDLLPDDPLGGNGERVYHPMLVV